MVHWSCCLHHGSENYNDTGGMSQASYVTEQKNPVPVAILKSTNFMDLGSNGPILFSMESSVGIMFVY